MIYTNTKFKWKNYEIRIIIKDDIDDSYIVESYIFHKNIIINRFYLCDFDKKILMKWNIKNFKLWLLQYFPANKKVEYIKFLKEIKKIYNK